MTRNYRVDVFYGTGVETVHYTTEFEQYWLAKSFAKAVVNEPNVCSVYMLERMSDGRFDITAHIGRETMTKDKLFALAEKYGLASTESKKAAEAYTAAGMADAAKNMRVNELANTTAYFTMLEVFDAMNIQAEWAAHRETLDF